MDLRKFFISKKKTYNVSSTMNHDADEIIVISKSKVDEDSKKKKLSLWKQLMICKTHDMAQAERQQQQMKVYMFLS